MPRQLRGYLNEPYRVFYNTGLPAQEVPPHYHDFRKLVILLGGKIGYMIEEQRYELRPGSLVFVEAGMIHRPLLHAGDQYERIIIYLSNDFLNSRNGLGAGFELTGRAQSFAVELPAARKLIESRAALLTDKSCSTSHNPHTLQESRLSEFLISAGDIVADCGSRLVAPVSANPVVLSVIDYIGDNIRGDLSVDAIASRVHLSRSYLMHMFRAETGYTVKDFVMDKRLFLARHLVEKGVPMAAAAEQSGFASYTSFYRAYLDKYGVSPKATGRSAAKARAPSGAVEE